MFGAEAGATYYVQVGAYNTGDMIVNIEFVEQELVPPDLTVTIADTPDPVTSTDEYVGYSLTVSNVGAARANGIAVTTTLTGSTFADASPGCSAEGQVVTCYPATMSRAAASNYLDPGASQEFVIVAVPPTTAGTISATSVATLAETDATPADNTATESTTVEGSIVAQCLGHPATIVGVAPAENGGASETIMGTDGDDVIIANDGPDVVYGLGGNDFICMVAG